MSGFTHLDASGAARMVDVGGKEVTARTATATGRVDLSAECVALLRGEVDLAVHSLKDLPTYPHEGIVLAALPPREDPRDVVVARDGLTLGELPVGSRVGTGSPPANVPDSRPSAQRQW